MLFVARLSWEFGTGAEAHDAYLITELGNLFPVKDPTSNLVTITNDGAVLDQVNRIGPELTQAFFQLSARIADKPADGGSFVYGTNSMGTVVPYQSYFTIPASVANSSTGYVGLFQPDEPHTSVSIPAFFSTYEYSNATNTLRDIGYSDNVEDFDSIEITTPTNSRRVAVDTITNSYDGFYLTDPGTYAVKLHHGYAYHLPYGINCDGIVCDRAAVITNSINLLSATSSGLSIRTGVSAMAENGYYLSSYTDSGSNGAITGYVRGTVDVPDRQISGVNNVVITGAASSQITRQGFIDPSKTCYENHNWQRYSRDIGSFAFTPQVNTSFSNGALLITSLTDTYTIDFGFRENSSGCNPVVVYRPPCVYPDTPPVSISESAESSKCIWFDVSSFQNSISIYDRGVPVTRQPGYWAINATDTMYGNTPTVYNPNNVVVTGTNTYMIIQKNTPSWTYFDVAARNATNASLEIVDLPPNTMFSITDSSGTTLAVGATSGAGTVNVPYSEIGFEAVGGLTLNLFHGVPILRDLPNMTINDHLHNAFEKINLTTRGDVIYTPERYVEFLLLLGGNITNTMLSTGDATTAITPEGKCADTGFSLPYLSKDHETTQYIRVPVVVGFSLVCMEVNGSPILMEYSYILETDGGSTTTTTVGDSSSITDTSDPFHSSQALQTSVIVTITQDNSVINVNGRASSSVSVAGYKGFGGSHTSEPSVSRFNKYIDVYMDIYKNNVLVQDNAPLGRLLPDRVDIHETHGLQYNGETNYYSCWFRGSTNTCDLSREILARVDYPYQHTRVDSYTDYPNTPSRHFRDYYKDIIPINPSANSVCTFDSSYSINGPFSSIIGELNLIPGDVLKIDVFARHSVNFDVNCATTPYEAYGAADISFVLHPISISVE